MSVWRFIFSGFLHPITNMAIDRALIDIYKVSGIPVFRIYGWRPYGFSTGYGQKIEDVLDIPSCIRDGIPFVKRPTGGGIIFHGDEVTYSLVCSEKDIGAPATVKDGYKIICSFILAAYRYYGATPVFAIESGQLKKERSTLCFASFEDYDILIKGKKIGGNAQKRIRDIIMQHGSLPLSLDYEVVLKYVKERVSLSRDRTTSVSEVAGRNIGFDEFAEVLKNSFINTFGVKLEEKDLTEEEMEIAGAYERQLLQEKDCLIRNR